MRIKIFLIILFSLYLFKVNAQISNESIVQVKGDTINKYDSLGRKTGYWVVYLSRNFQVVKNKKNATYYGYARYSNGIKFDFPVFPYKYIRKITVKHGDFIKNNDSLELLNGTYYLYIKNGELIKECVLKNGVLQVVIDYTKDGEKMITNFTDNYRNFKFSYSTKYYSASNELLRNVFEILENSKWKKIKIE